MHVAPAPAVLSSSSCTRVVFLTRMDGPTGGGRAGMVGRLVGTGAVRVSQTPPPRAATAAGNRASKRGVSIETSRLEHRVTCERVRRGVAGSMWVRGARVADRAEFRATTRLARERESFEATADTGRSSKHAAADVWPAPAGVRSRSRSRQGEEESGDWRTRVRESTCRSAESHIGRHRLRSVAGTIWPRRGPRACMQVASEISTTQRRYLGTATAAPTHPGPGRRRRCCRHGGRISCRRGVALAPDAPMHDLHATHDVTLTRS